MRTSEQPEGALESTVAAGQPKPRRRPGLMAIIVLVIVGLAAVGGGAGGLVWGHARKATQEQIAAAGARAFGFQWRWLRAGQVFPATVSYTPTLGIESAATLVGIAPQSPCAAAVDATLGHALTKAGCVTMLRATYTDESRTVLTTVGVAVLPTAAAAAAVSGQPVRDGRGGLLPVSFPGTVASQFTRSARETWGEQASGGPYLIYSATGYADGRVTTQDPAAFSTNAGETATNDIPNGLVSALLATFTQPANPCAVREVRC